MHTPAEHTQETFPPIEKVELTFTFKNTSASEAIYITLECSISQKEVLISLPIKYSFKDFKDSSKDVFFFVEKTNNKYSIRYKDQASAEITAQALQEKINNSISNLTNTQFSDFHFMLDKGLDGFVSIRSNEEKVTVNGIQVTSNFSDPKLDAVTRIIIQRFLAARQLLIDCHLTDPSSLNDLFHVLKIENNFTQQFVFSAPLVLPPVQAAPAAATPSAASTSSSSASSESHTTSSLHSTDSSLALPLAQNTYPPIAARLILAFEQGLLLGNFLEIACTISDQGFTLSLPLAYDFQENFFTFEAQGDKYSVAKIKDRQKSPETWNHLDVQQKLSELAIALITSTYLNFHIIFDEEKNKRYSIDNDSGNIRTPENGTFFDPLSNNLSLKEKIIAQRLEAVRAHLMTKLHNALEASQLLRDIAEQSDFKFTTSFPAPLQLPAQILTPPPIEGASDDLDNWLLDEEQAGNDDTGHPQVEPPAPHPSVTTPPAFEYNQNTYSEMMTSLTFNFEGQPITSITLQCIISKAGMRVSLPLDYNSGDESFTLKKLDYGKICKAFPAESKKEAQYLNHQQLQDEIKAIALALQGQRFKSFTIKYGIINNQSYSIHSNISGVSLPGGEELTTNFSDPNLRSEERVVIQRLMAARNTLNEYNLTNVVHLGNFLNTLETDNGSDQTLNFKSPLELPPVAATTVDSSSRPSSTKTQNHVTPAPLPAPSAGSSVHANPQDWKPFDDEPPLDLFDSVDGQEKRKQKKIDEQQPLPKKATNKPSSLGSIGLAVFFFFAALISAAAIALLALAMLSSPLVPLNLLLLPLTFKIGLLVTTSLLTVACVGLTAWFGYQAYNIDSSNSVKGLAFDKNAVRGTYAALPPSEEAAVEHDSTLQANKDQNQSCGWLWKICKTEECCADQSNERSNSLEL